MGIMVFGVVGLLFIWFMYMWENKKCVREIVNWIEEDFVNEVILEEWCGD